MRSHDRADGAVDAGVAARIACRPPMAGRTCVIAEDSRSDPPGPLTPGGKNAPRPASVVA